MEDYNGKSLKNQDLTDLKTISKSDRVWDKHRSAASKVDVIYRESGDKQMLKYSERVNSCSPWLKFHKVETGIKLNQAFFCKVRNCPVCQWRRSLRWKAKIYKALPLIQEKYPAGRWLFLTLTIKNCCITDLRNNLHLLNKSWDRLSKRRRINKNLLGFIKSVEVTKGKNNSAHPHLHILLFVKSTYFKKGEYINQDEFTEQWQSALKVDYKPMVHITAVKNKTGKNSMDGVIAETLKYAVKESDMTENDYWFIEYTKQTFKTRAISSGGILKDLIADVSNGEMINTESNEEEQEDIKNEPEFNFYWFENSQKYRGYM